MFPVAFLAGLAGLIIYASRSLGKPDPSGHVEIESAEKVPKPKLITSGNILDGDAQYLRQIHAIRTLVRIGKPIPRTLLDDTLTEAYDRSDWKVIHALTPNAPQERQESVESAEESESPMGELASPEEWQELLEKLKTEDDTYATDKHVGAYHHNRERLKQLGIDAGELKTAEAQKAALEKDLISYAETEKQLIADYGGDLIDINGQTHPVTMSGVLGLLKAAGPKHARSWFKNPEERKQFPHTTETFLRTNGLF